MTVEDLEIPLNATIRLEYVKCGNPDCQNSHAACCWMLWINTQTLVMERWENSSKRKLDCLLTELLTY
jgi:hypothetical protein